MEDIPASEVTPNAKIALLVDRHVRPAAPCYGRLGSGPAVRHAL